MATVVAQLVERSRDTRDMQFESSHKQIKFTFSCIENSVIKTKLRKRFLEKDWTLIA